MSLLTIGVTLTEVNEQAYLRKRLTLNKYWLEVLATIDLLFVRQTKGDKCLDDITRFSL
jgi:hypothetical protein